MSADPVVSPADTDLPVRHCSRTEPHNPHEWNLGLVHCPGIPLDRKPAVSEPVSPADTPNDLAVTIRRAIPTVRLGRRSRVPLGDVERDALAALDALLAVGERDKAEIAGLKAEVARLADRAVCSGCGQDVDEGGVCHTPECHTGEMIPSSDLPGALLHLCEENAEEREEWRSDWEALRAEAKELERAGERDRRQIARLTADFNELRLWTAQHLGAIDLEDVDGDVAQVLSSLDSIVLGNAGCTEEGDYTPAQWRVLQLCAVLADEEDAG